MKKTAIASAIAIGFGIASGAPNAAPHTGEFCMYDAMGGFISSFEWVGTKDTNNDGLIDCDEQVSGTIDSSTFTLSSPQTFFNQDWNAHDGVILAPGTHQIDTIQGGIYDFTVGAGKVGGHVLFDWGSPSPTPCGKANCDIDVVLVWDRSCVFTATNEECTYTSTDVTAVNPVGPDGIPGLEMLDGAFAGSAANFNLVALFPLPGAPSFTPPANPNTVVPEQPTPAVVNVDLGTVADEAPAGTVMHYSTDGLPDNDINKIWIPDDNGTNTTVFSATQTVNNFTVRWRATNNNQTPPVTYLDQTVTVTVTDTTAPVINAANAPTVNHNVVSSTAESVCFGAVSATDATEPNLTIEWSHDGFNFNPANPDTGSISDNCSTGFGPNANIITWRATDASSNASTTTQDVTLILPPGIVGSACVIDLATAGTRLLEGEFAMRTSTGAPNGSIDPGVTGSIDTTIQCTNPDPAVCGPNANPPTPSAMTINSGQAFFGFDWVATPVRLFGPSQTPWTFEACPLPRTQDPSSGDWESPDGSNRCGDATTPNPLTIQVNQGQLGAHMLFAWGALDPNKPCGRVNCAIDVGVVWDVNCNKFELTTTDPDGDGVLGSKMVDGPFKDNNAAFDLKTQPGEMAIADGGYTVSTLSTQNPAGGESPIPVTSLALPAFTADSSAVRSCVGGCAKFSTSDLLSATDGGGAYNYAQVVVPLSEATPFWSLYRKYNETTNTWGPFVIDGRNNVKSAPLETATDCPEPGNGIYIRPAHGSLADKLRGGDMCVQLTIEDNGPNDANPAPGTVDDPGGVAEVQAVGIPSPATSGGCSLSATPVSAGKGGAWWLLAGLISLLGLKRRLT